MNDIEIAKQAHKKPIVELAENILSIPRKKFVSFGDFKAKYLLDNTLRSASTQTGDLILVSAISPTPLGEGKTTTTVGLGDALNSLGKKTIICLREPSLGPCFGLKGGAAGGGYAQVVPMEDINLHFTGDFHAIGSAHNLLAAMVDNHIHQGNKLGFDIRAPLFRRVLDMNDRSLRSVITSLGGKANGYPKESGFDITVASEVMAIFCLAESLQDLKQKLSKIIVGQRLVDSKPISAGDLNAEGAMTALLKDALNPNFVQTLENNLAIVHGGPFANIAHGCNSIIATKTALKLADYVVTEAGFGADLGAEKFLNIKSRMGGLSPKVVVLVATVRALKYHGGMNLSDLTNENHEALSKGFQNLERHLFNINEHFGLQPVVAINQFSSDTESELQWLVDRLQLMDVPATIATHWSDGSKGAIELANLVLSVIGKSPERYKLLYKDDWPIWKKIEIIAKKIYGATQVIAEDKIKKKIDALDETYGSFPVCVAKTPLSFSTDPSTRGKVQSHTMEVKDIRVSAGAGFVVALAGDVMTMPGLPRVPAAEKIDVTDDGEIIGLF